jgi:hypothetical protein
MSEVRVLNCYHFTQNVWTSVDGPRLTFLNTRVNRTMKRWLKAFGSPIRLIASTFHDGAAQYSPDGRRIVFESERKGSVVFGPAKQMVRKPKNCFPGVVAVHNGHRTGNASLTIALDKRTQTFTSCAPAVENQFS